MDGPTRRAVWLAFALLLGLRLVYLAQYVELPFLYGPVFDAQVYLAQADAVRAGRFGDATLLAFSPLYGYLLAALGAHAGSIAPVLLQLLLGVANVALIWRITRVLFGARAGLLAAGWYAAYGPLLFFETKIMSETLGLTLLLCALERFVSAEFVSGRWRSTLGCGVLLASAVLARASLLFCVPFFALAALLRPLSRNAGAVKDVAPTAIRSCLGLTLGASLLLGSYGVFMRVQSGLFVPVILVSNTAAQATRGDFQGDLSLFRAAPDRPVGAWSVVEQAETRLRAVRRGARDPETERPSIDVVGWLRQMPKKFSLTWRDSETSFDYGYYGERTEAPALYLTFASFGMLTCFAVLGIWYARRERNTQALFGLLPVMAGVLVVTTLFHPSTRYRLPLLVALAPLSGLAWARSLAFMRAGRHASIAALCACTALFAFVNARRGLSLPGAWELRVAEAAAMAGDLPECRRRLLAALSAEPASAEVRDRARYVSSLLPGCWPNRHGRRHD